MQNLKLNPTKRDYVVLNGKPVGSDDVTDAAYYSLTIPKDRWIYGEPDQGSLLYTLQNVKHSSSVEQQFATYADDAVKRQLIDTGKAVAVQSGNIQTTKTGSSNQVQIVPSVQEISNQLKFNGV